MLGRLLALVLLATTSVTKQRQISCHFSTQAKYWKQKYYLVHHAGFLYSLVIIIIILVSGVFNNNGYKDDDKNIENKIENGGCVDQILMRGAGSLSEAQRRRIDFSNLLTSGLNRAYDHAFIFSYNHTFIQSYFHTIILS